MSDRVRLLTGNGVWITLKKGNIHSISKTIGEKYTLIKTHDGINLMVEHSYEEAIRIVFGDKK